MTFQCDVESCGKLFSCKKTLKEHQRTHTGERPYICPICQVTFAQYSSMQKHQRVHDKKKPYKCKYIGCQQAFTQISNLIRHERIHTGEKPYLCHLCTKRFASGSNLKQHIQVHNNEVQRIQFRCFAKPCDKAYLYVSSLKKHIQVSHPVEYETLIKTNRFDLQNCKELIPHGDRILHQLSDHDMNEEEEVDDSNAQAHKQEEEKKSLQVFEQCQVASQLSSVLQEEEESLLKKRPLITSNKDQWYLLDEKNIKTEIPFNFNPLKRQRLLPQPDEQQLNHNGRLYTPSEADFSNYYSGLERRDSLNPLQQKVQQISLSLKRSVKNQESPKCNQTIGFIASMDTTPRFLENSEKRVQFPQIPIPRGPYQRIHEAKQGNQMLNQSQVSAQNQEAIFRTSQELSKQKQSQPQLPKLTSLGLFDNNYLQSVQSAYTSFQNHSPTSDIDAPPVFDFSTLSSQALNKAFQQNVQWNQIPNTTLPLPVPFSHQQQQQSNTNWGGLFNNPKNQQFFQQNSFAQQTHHAQQQSPNVDVFTTLKQLQAELKQEASNSVFAKIQHYAVIAASATLVQLGLNSGGDSVPPPSQQNTVLHMNSNSPSVQQQQQQFQHFQQQQQKIQNNTLTLKQGSFGLEAGTPSTYNHQKVVEDNNSMGSKTEGEEISNFSFRNNNSIVKLDEDSFYFQGVNNRQHQSQPQKRVYQHKSVLLKNHKELRVSTQPVTLQPTVSIFSRKNSGSRENSFSKLSSEVMASYQKQQIPTLSFINYDNSNEIQQSQKYLSLLSPRINLMNKNVPATTRKHSLFKKFSYTAIYKSKERQESDPPSSSYFGEDGDEMMNAIVNQNTEAEKKSCICGGSNDGKLKPCKKCHNDTMNDIGKEVPHQVNPQFQVSIDRERQEQLDIKNMLYNNNNESQQKIDSSSNVQIYSENIESKEQVPFTALNSTQQKILQKNPKQVQIIFSKLPCIKTCMSKMEIPSNASKNDTNAGGGCGSGSSNCGKKEKKLSFELGENDFATYSANQISAASCKSTCDAQKICPELLPTNCDDFFEKRCDCTSYCKKMLKYMQQFVKDKKHYAEIEDLCKVFDEPKENNNSSDQLMISPVSSVHNEQSHQ